MLDFPGKDIGMLLVLFDWRLDMRNAVLVFGVVEHGDNDGPSRHYD